jgi:hypothetical protein
MLACCALLLLASGCIAVPGPQQPCPYSLVSVPTPAGVLVVATEDACD